MYKTASKTFFRHGATALALAAGILAADAALIPSEAAAAVPANLQGYCNRFFPNSTFQMQFTQWGPRYQCRQVNAYGYTLQGIDPGAVCRWQTGNSAFRASGRQVQCNGQIARSSYTVPNQGFTTQNAAPQTNSQPVRRATSPNLNAYCSRTYYGSVANFSYQLNSWICTQRTNGGYGLRHYRVNFGLACRMTTGRTSFRFVGDRRRVQCT